MSLGSVLILETLQLNLTGTLLEDAVCRRKKTLSVSIRLFSENTIMANSYFWSMSDIKESSVADSENNHNMAPVDAGVEEESSTNNKKISGYYGNNNNMQEESSEESSSEEEEEEEEPVERISAHRSLMNLHQDDAEKTSDLVEKFIKQILQESSISNRNIEERAKYIPLRLSMWERKQLRLMEASLTVSEYTDKFDILKFGSKAKRIMEQLKDICAILSGLLVASDYDLGKEVIANRNFKDNATFFQNIFEVGRRHKIMNPEKMRTEYGKLIYLLQDSAIPEVQTMLEFECKRNIRTVYSHLKAAGAEEALK